MLSLDYTVLTETKACPLQSQNSYSAFLCRIRDGLAQTHQREKRQKEVKLVRIQQMRKLYQRYSKAGTLPTAETRNGSV